MRNIIFIPAYNNFDNEYKECIDTWKHYARLHNVDIFVAGDRIDYQQESWGNSIWHRWNDPNLLKKEWDNLLMVDADTMVRWDAPNIFEVCADKSFCVVKDASNTGLYHLSQWTSVNGDIKTPADKYFNCGVIVSDRKNYITIANNLSKYYEYWNSFHLNSNSTKVKKPDAVDQTPVNILSWELFPEKIHYLSYMWNNMVMMKYDDASFLNDSYIWHFTGPRMGGWGKKKELITQIFDHIKNYYE